MDLRAHSRARARLPGGALPRRPARRAGPRRGDSAGHAARRTAVRGFLARRPKTRVEGPGGLAMSERSLTHEDSTAPVTEDHLDAAFDADVEEMPQARMTRRYAFLFGFFVVSAIAFLYFGLPQIAGLSDTWERINRGDPYWLAVAVVLEAVSFGGYIILFRTVFVRGDSQIDWRGGDPETEAGPGGPRPFPAP